MADMSVDSFEEYINTFLIEGACLTLPEECDRLEEIKASLYELLAFPLPEYRTDLITMAVHMLEAGEVFEFDAL